MRHPPPCETSALLIGDHLDTGRESSPVVPGTRGMQGLEEAIKVGAGGGGEWGRSTVTF